MRFTGATHGQRMNIWGEYEAVLALPRSVESGVMCYGSQKDLE